MSYALYGVAFYVCTYMDTALLVGTIEICRQAAELIMSRFN
jgi:hypothetical protein